ncbi:hypothetical protein [Caulobacter sp. S45]|jgi:hypothetical protein|uniref:hypothetical protein n=1 Tax=Caulobacter sp. S45 TaxID=1641861 RepID=UPI0020B163A1|nr:hypothetical protein [Caulobacter sp. S45]
MIHRLRRLMRNVIVAFGFVLMAIGLVGAFLPTHLLGFLLVLGLILVLRNSIRWRRRFILMQRRYPRYGYPLRRLLRGEVWPVIWHELLRSERLFVPRRFHRLRRWRFALNRSRRKP